MNKLMELGEVAAEVAFDDRAKRDEVCRLEDLAVEVVRTEKRNAFELRIPEVGSRRMSAWAGQQFFQKRLGIPYEFLAERCSAGLAQGIVDQFLSESRPEALVVRLHQARGGGWRVRAVLGASNQLFDNRDLLDVVLDVAARERLRVERYHIDAETFHCRLLSDDPVDAGVSRVDPHHFGILLRNSEVGRGRPEALHTVVRQVCSNGMVGFTDEPLLRIHPASLHSIDKVRLRSEFQERFERVFPGRAEVIATIRSARSRRVEVRTLDDEFRAIHRRFNLPIRNMPLIHEAVVRESVEGGRTVTLFSLASVLNRAAQSMRSEEGVRYESAAWSLMKDAARN